MADDDSPEALRSDVRTGIISGVVAFACSIVLLIRSHSFGLVGVMIAAIVSQAIGLWNMFILGPLIRRHLSGMTTRRIESASPDERRR